MSNVYIGQIIQGGWNFAPRGFHYCDGSLMSIAQNSALFSLLGTNFGGDGQTTFGLPDLRGRSMVNIGQGPGLSNYVLGEASGTETTTLTTPNMPAHNHAPALSITSSLNVAQSAGQNQQAQGNGVSILGRSVDTSPANALPKIYAPAASTPTVTLAGLNVAGTVTEQTVGSNAPFSNLSPFLAVSVVIALQGIFPSRN